MKKNILNKNYYSLLIILVIALLFFLPYFGAKFVYQRADRWLSHTTNRGILIKPTTQLSSLGLISDKHWQILYIQQNQCQQDCLERLIMLRQLRLAFGSDNQRISYGLISQENQPKIEKLFGTALPHAQFFLIKDPKWKKYFPSNLQAIIHQGFIISDPVGNIILYYPPNAEPKALYEDLKHLLKASRIG